MKPEQVIAEFGGTQTRCAEALTAADPDWPITQRGVSEWVTAGSVPRARQWQIEALTDGRLSRQAA